MRWGGTANTPCPDAMQDGAARLLEILLSEGGGKLFSEGVKLCIAR